MTVYVAIDDPHSYLLLQCLAPFQARFGVAYDFRTVLNKQDKMFPAPKLWDQNGFQDGVWLAKLYGLRFPAEPPDYTAAQNHQFTAQLLQWESQPEYLPKALSLFASYWHGNDVELDRLASTAVAHQSETYQQQLATNEARLKENGHYLSGMLHYGGEWYWGLNRLQYLERRLLDLRLQTDNDSGVKFDLGQRNFLNQAAQGSADGREKTPLVVYWSVRSPYSYLGLVRGRQLAEHYGVPFIIKPVLPMLMRDMPVPRTKALYIAQDTKREAKQHGLPFGRIADPLGLG